LWPTTRSEEYKGVGLDAMLRSFNRWARSLLTVGGFRFWTDPLATILKPIASSTSPQKSSSGRMPDPHTSFLCFFARLICYLTLDITFSDDDYPVIPDPRPPPQISETVCFEALDYIEHVSLFFITDDQGSSLRYSVCIRALESVLEGRTWKKGLDLAEMQGAWSYRCGQEVCTNMEAGLMCARVRILTSLPLAILITCSAC
jgi:hypothetical protein